jgi:hypothetical protein
MKRRACCAAYGALVLAASAMATSRVAHAALRRGATLHAMQAAKMWERAQLAEAANAKARAGGAGRGPAPGGGGGARACALRPASLELPKTAPSVPAPTYPSRTRHRQAAAASERRAAAAKEVAAILEAGAAAASPVLPRIATKAAAPVKVGGGRRVAGAKGPRGRRERFAERRKGRGQPCLGRQAPCLPPPPATLRPLTRSLSTTPLPPGL